MSQTSIKPASCYGCALQAEGEGFYTSPLLPSNGVVLLADSLKDVDGKTSFMLTRLLGWAGLDRGEFSIIPVTFCEPLGNLSGHPQESNAVAHCKLTQWGSILDHARVIVPMGNAALHALTGRRGILETRGYIRPGPGVTHIIPTVSPRFILQGQAKYSSAFINDVRKATQLAATGFPVQLTEYLLDPLPEQAYAWALEYRAAIAADPSIRLAYDIETPWADEDESERGEDDSWTILRVAFSYKPFHALAVRWAPEYMAAIRLLLGSSGAKVDWNGANFDRPRIRNAGVELNGPQHDAMVAWHVLHSDLPKSLAFVATFTCPFQPEWKHLSSREPAFYNATDADVTLRSMIAIEEGLRSIPNLWEVYERDIIRLDPVLRSMEAAGMPINPATRLDRAGKLTELLAQVTAEIEALAPPQLRKYSPAAGYIKAPISTDGLVQIIVESEVKRCSHCQLVNPTKPHFKRFKKPTLKKPQNPCCEASITTATEEVTRWAMLEPWSTSSKNLLAFQQFHGRIIPQKWDKKLGRRKPSMGREGLNQCARKYPKEPLYPLVLRQRELQKIAGTYIGYIEEEANEDAHQRPLV